jgi:hypothetical protein
VAIQKAFPVGSFAAQVAAANVEGLRIAFDLSQIGLTQATAVLAQVRVLLAKAQVQLGALHSAYDQAPWWAKPVFWNLVVIADHAKQGLANAEQVAANLHSIAQATAHQARISFETALAVVILIGEGQAFLDRSYNGFEWSLTVEARGKVSAGPVSVPGVGAKASAALNGTAKLRYELMPEGEKLAVTLVLEGKGEGSAQMGVGVAGAVKLGAEVEFDFRRPGGSSAYELHVPTIKLTGDAVLRGTLGVGLVGEYGVGRATSITIAVSDFVPVLEGIADAIHTDDPMTAVAAIGALQCTYELQDRWEAALVTGGAGSAAGTGGELKIGATWADRGDAIKVEGTTIGKVLTAFPTQESLNTLASQFDACLAEARADVETVVGFLP